MIEVSKGLAWPTDLDASVKTLAVRGGERIAGSQTEGERQKQGDKEGDKEIEIECVCV